jgi:hypothetical protein
MWFSLSFNCLEKLNLSESSEEREEFLSEVYHLQEESGQVDDEEEQMMDKEIEGTLEIWCSKIIHVVAKQS